MPMRRASVERLGFEGQIFGNANSFDDLLEATPFCSKEPPEAIIRRKWQFGRIAGVAAFKRVMSEIGMKRQIKSDLEEHLAKADEAGGTNEEVAEAADAHVTTETEALAEGLVARAVEDDADLEFYSEEMLDQRVGLRHKRVIKEELYQWI